jgi:hypothetical protein
MRNRNNLFVLDRQIALIGLHVSKFRHNCYYYYRALLMPNPNLIVSHPKPNLPNSFQTQIPKADAQICSSQLKRNHFLMMVVSTAAGACFFFLLNHPIPAIIIWSATAMLTILPLVHPGFLNLWHRCLVRFSEWVATGLAWALLTPFYLLVFVPVRAIRRFTGKNELELKPNPDAQSYWNPSQESSHPERYRRQS